MNFSSHSRAGIIAGSDEFDLVLGMHSLIFCKEVSVESDFERPWMEFS